MKHFDSFSYTACTSEGTPKSLPHFVSEEIDGKKPVVFIVGAFAKGSDTIDYAEEYLSFSSYPLSASVACGKLCDTFEQLWSVL